jgi:pimeloyl-ACP methyl ester carboxylesterase
MDRTSHFFHYQKASLHYSVSGKGNESMLCFHGYGHNEESFSELEKILLTKYTFYSFDLFFHGKSEWKTSKEPLSDKIWSEIISAFLKEKNISNFSLLGYSIGARPIWSIVQSFADKIKEVIVIAPDGLFTNTWYGLATRSKLSRALFKFLLSKYQYIDSLIKIGSLIKIVPPVTARFAEGQLRTEEQRKRVYNTWVVYRKLKAHRKLSSEINRKSIPLTIYLGRHDKIITYKKMESFLRSVDKKDIITLEAGHSNLTAAVVNYLKINF